MDVWYPGRWVAILTRLRNSLEFCTTSVKMQIRLIPLWYSSDISVILGRLYGKAIITVRVRCEHYLSGWVYPKQLLHPNTVTVLKPDIIYQIFEMPRMNLGKCKKWSVVGMDFWRNIQLGVVGQGDGASGVWEREMIQYQRSHLLVLGIDSSGAFGEEFCAQPC